jgi:hypothetical protein
MARANKGPRFFLSSLFMILFKIRYFHADTVIPAAPAGFRSGDGFSGIIRVSCETLNPENSIQ